MWLAEFSCSRSHELGWEIIYWDISNLWVATPLKKVTPCLPATTDCWQFLRVGWGRIIICSIHDEMLAGPVLCSLPQTHELRRVTATWCPGHHFAAHIPTTSSSYILSLLWWVSIPFWASKWSSRIYDPIQGRLKMNITDDCFVQRKETGFCSI